MQSHFGEMAVYIVVRTEARERWVVSGNCLSLLANTERKSWKLAIIAVIRVASGHSGQDGRISRLTKLRAFSHAPKCVRGVPEDGSNCPVPVTGNECCREYIFPSKIESNNTDGVSCNGILVRGEDVVLWVDGRTRVVRHIA